MRPVQVLDHQADLLARLTRPIVRNGWSHHVALDYVAAGLSEGSAASSGAALIQMLERTVRVAPAYHLSDELAAVVTYAATQLDGLDRVDLSLAPTATGLVRIDQGLPVKDLRGQTMKVNWIVWGPVEMKFGAGEPTAATAVWMFNDQHDDPDEVARKAWEQLLVKRGPEAVVRADREFGRYGLIGVTSMHPGARMGPQWMPTAAEDAARVLESGDVPSDGTNVTRLVHSLWLLMGQRIVTVADADVDRKTARRAARAGLPPRVTVVYLRQSKRSPGTGTGAPLTYRMMVGLATQGFWRHSRVGAAYPGAIEREPGVFVVKQWIMPYVRGPEGAPMHTPDHVYAIR